MPRKQIDLRVLPVWLQYVVAIAVAGAVSALAWYVGRNRPKPAWFEHGVMPALGWVAIVVLLFAATRGFRRRGRP